MSLSIRKSAVLIAVAAVIGLGTYEVLRTWKLVGESLNEESARMKYKNEVAFEMTGLAPRHNENVSILQTVSETRAVTAFRGSLYAATGGGLAVFSGDGVLEKRYTVTDGLPESDLTALCVFRDILFIGTRSKGLVAFDGENFNLYRFTDRKSQSIDAIAATAGELMIGTFDGGLISFDGARFVEIMPEETRIKGVTSILAGDSETMVGTYASGIWIRDGSAWKHFTNSDGLPSNRVVSVFRKDAKTYAATDLGLAMLDGDRFVTVARQANVTSAAVIGDSIMLTTENGAILSAGRRVEPVRTASASTRNARFASVGDALFLISDDGIAGFDGALLKSFAAEEKDSLSNNFVSAVAVDENGALWVGTFRGGIDVFGSDGRKLAHIESPDVREVNFIRGGPSPLAATSKGLIEFGAGFKPLNTIPGDAIASRSVTHFSGDFVATVKGLAHYEKDGFRLFTAQNGLPSNSTYATLESGGRLFVGTLGGLAEIVSGRVERVFKDSNSNLDTNWVTALAEVRDRIFIGTYGGGIFELLPSGEIRTFRAETGKFVVNPNAFATDGRRLYIGTLDGLRVLDLETQEWRRIIDVLPSATVMSITVAGDSVIVGTTSGVARINAKYFESL